MGEEGTFGYVRDGLIGSSSNLELTPAAYFDGIVITVLPTECKDSTGSIQLGSTTKPPKDCTWLQSNWHKKNPDKLEDNCKRKDATDFRKRVYEWCPKTCGKAGVG